MEVVGSEWETRSQSNNQQISADSRCAATLAMQATKRAEVVIGIVGSRAGSGW